MKKLIFLFVLSFVVSGLHAQKLVEKRDRHNRGYYDIEVENMDSLFVSYDNGKYKQLHAIMTVAKNDAKYEEWKMQFINRILPEDIKEVVKKECNSPILDSVIFRIRGSYPFESFEVVIYFDQKEKVITTRFVLSEGFKKALSEEQLKRLYNIIAKEKINVWDNIKLVEGNEKATARLGYDLAAMARQGLLKFDK